MNLARLRDFTPARVALGRSGDSMPTRALLDFQLAHARARDAVNAQLDPSVIGSELGRSVLVVNSAARDRAEYLKRPDLGRLLNQTSAAQIDAARGEYAVAFIIADGLSATAVHRHAPPLLAAVMPDLSGLCLAPIVIAKQARVALGDQIGFRIGAALTAMLIGERPGLSSPDSLGVYLTWNPHPGVTDAERNCISNIRTEGLSYAAAKQKLLYLIFESRRRRLSGVNLKEDAPALPAGTS